MTDSMAGMVTMNYGAEMVTIRSKAGEIMTPSLEMAETIDSEAEMGMTS